ncbi:hypothetical protein PGT21_033913 [Puccinia graminis f. sp. tritici]|uniref:tripeptidyl-peptidase II n=1 Tax=Puccinia graminis f. sp. tritici TaxID=56615 RepID=A0A5B0QKG7_PUCGR|nr:hypothetical protein PGT21_033913 [Puccinia graminis f. sp. tritici]
MQPPVFMGREAHAARLVSTFLIMFFSLVTFISAATQLDKIVHEKRVPNSLWKRQKEFQSIVGPSFLVSLKFGLKQSNLDTLHDELMKVSHPDSSSYGHHWSPERVKEHFSPSAQAIDEVTAWLKSQKSHLGALHQPRMSRGGTWINIQLPLSEAENLLDTKYHLYLHEATGQTHIACEDYKLPERLFRHIDMVMPTVHFDTVPTTNKYQYAGFSQDVPINSRKQKREMPTGQSSSAPQVIPVPGAARRLGNPSSGNIPHYSKDFNPSEISNMKHDLAHCSNVTTIECLKALYKFGDYQMTSPTKHTLAIVEYTPQSVIYKDMDLFFSTFAPKVKGSRPNLIPIDGGELNQETTEFGLNGESNLDLQYSMPLVHPLNISLYQVGDPEIGGSFNNFLDALDSSYCSSPLDPMQDGLYPNPRGYPKRDCGIVNPANVISTSYGMNEADATPSYLIRQCNEYGKLGLMGTTFLFSSGDNGVAGNRGVCLSRDGSQSVEGKIFNPSFPGTCPYVTSVGATQVSSGKTVQDPEVACFTKIQSGGGFSNVFKMPNYQASAVQNFFKNHPPKISQDRYNSSMRTRGFPDLSANGANYVVAVEGKFGLVYGTSASAPVVASMLTMINDARISVGKKPVGFINPAIYSKRFRKAFNDIKDGTNPGCDTEGFSAVTGWDPVTGLGTMDFTKFLPIWKDL